MAYNNVMSQRPRRAAWILAAVVFASSPVCAQFQLQSEPDSEWDKFVPPVADPGSTPNSPVGPTTPEGGFSAPERVRFGEKQRGSAGALVHVPIISGRPLPVGGLKT